MRCLACGSAAITERPERTGTVLSRVLYPSDVIALRDGSAVLLSEGSPLAMVLWRARYKLSLRDLPERFAARGMVSGHTTRCGPRPASTQRHIAP